MKNLLFILSLFFLQNSILFSENLKLYEFNPDKDFPEENQKKYFFLYELENLKKPLPISYILLIDWEEYTQKFQILKRGILFTYRNLNAKKIYVAGNFSGWNLIPLKRNPYGIFYYVEPIDLKKYNYQNIYYKFYIDGLWTLDPLNDSREIVDNEILNVYFVNEKPYLNLAKTEILEKKKIADHQNIYLVEFKIHEKLLQQKLRKKQIYKVYVVGNFNFWDQEANELKKDSQGVYKTQIYLPGGVYYYNFIVDGEWILDPLNENTKYLTDFQKILNFIELP